MGFQVALVVKKTPANTGDTPSPAFLLENPMDTGAYWATVYRVSE